MPRVIVQAEPGEGRDAEVTLAERVLPDHLESDHFAAQFVERVGWAVVDAAQAEASVPLAAPPQRG
jgi:hypothetical protein